MSYLISLLLSGVVGIAYALPRVTPPAPPLVALVGLLGMLAGEKAVHWARADTASGRSIGSGRAATEHEAAAERPGGAAHGG